MERIEGNSLSSGSGIVNAFVQYFHGLGIDRDFALAFHGHLQRYNSLNQLIEPKQLLCEDLLICDEDLMETIIKMFKHFNRRLISSEAEQKPIKTVEDLLLLVWKQPREDGRH